MWTHPGAKLLFMGGELAAWSEWTEAGELDWDLLAYPAHAGVQRWVRELNEVYAREPALHALDHTPEGFEWIDVHDAEHSILSYLRWEHEWENFIAVVANFSVETWSGTRIAVPTPGEYEILLDSHDPRFSGSGGTRLHGPATETPLHGRPASLTLDLPALGFVLLRRCGSGAED